MRFDDFDTLMRVYETAHDYAVLPGLHIVARLDGRSFTQLTNVRHPFEHPFDARLRDLMVMTTIHLMERGFNVLYGYTQSDEISLLLHPDESAFGRKTRKLISILASEAGAKFSLLLGDVGSFDCRISELPSDELVIDYFRWRQADAHRNALNAHAYWMLRALGQSATAADRALRGMSVAGKNELLFQHGVNFNDVPNWQKRGVGVVWERYAKEAVNRHTGETVRVARRRLVTQLDLLLGDAYGAFIAQLLAEAQEDHARVARR
jgi:tRNA(His) 5'-end guanylyltransferase